MVGDPHYFEGSLGEGMLLISTVGSLQITYQAFSQVSQKTQSLYLLTGNLEFCQLGHSVAVDAPGCPWVLPSLFPLIGVVVFSQSKYVLVVEDELLKV